MERCKKGGDEREGGGDGGHRGVTHGEENVCGEKRGRDYEVGRMEDRGVTLASGVCVR